MAAVSQPGSRAGLITSLVIFVVLFFVAAVLAIVQTSTAKGMEDQLARLRTQYKDVIKDSEMTGEEYNSVKLVKDENANRGRSIFDIVVHQRDNLAKLISGQTGTTAAKAQDGAAAVIQSANKSLEAGGISIPGGSLNRAIADLTKVLMDRQSQLAALGSELAAGNDALKKQIDTYKKELDQHRQNVEAANTKATQTVQETTQYRAGKDEQVGQLEKTLQEAIEKGRKNAEDLNTQLAAKQQEIDKLSKERQQLILRAQRSSSTALGEAISRRPDGRIIEVGKNNVCYINLGLGKQISAGMTFEIYDKSEGIPRTGGSEDQLPIGKGSLEITHVSVDSSECRVIKLQPGQQLFVGDLIANIVYDPNVKLNFKIYGDFDIDQNGVATPQETEIIKRLVVQWGGNLNDKIDVDTDIVVMGKEPVLPNVTKEQLEANPILKFDYEKAEQALKAYEEIRNKTLELHIPLLNQNRFLYMIGYYDQARK